MFNLDLIGNDGGSVTDCLTWVYAHEVMEETGLPVVMYPCDVRGEPNIYVCGFDGPTVQQCAHSADSDHRAACAIGLLVRAAKEVKEIARRRA